MDKTKMAVIEETDTKEATNIKKKIKTHEKWKENMENILFKTRKNNGEKIQNMNKRRRKNLDGLKKKKKIKKENKLWQKERK